MKILLSKSIGIPVVTHNEGTTIAFSRMLVFHPDTGQLLGVEVKSSFFEQPLFLTMYDIVEWRRRKIFVKDDTSLLPAIELPRIDEVLERGISFFGNSVETETMKSLGRVHDIEFDTTLSQLTKLYVRSVVFLVFWGEKRLIPFSRILEVTPEKILVKDSLVKKKKIAVGDLEPTT